MRILVLDGNENHAVAAVRSLGAAGHQVEVGSAESWCKAAWSRFAEGAFRYPSPERDVDGFVCAIADQVHASRGTFVLPMTERTTLPLSEQRALISAAGGRLLLPSHDIVLRCFDKQQTTAVAKSLGITVPRTESIVDVAQARILAPNLPYPVVLKPGRSHEVAAGGAVRATGRPVYARDENGFLSAFAQIRARCQSVLAQEFVEGVGAGYFALMRHGELRAEFAHRRIRDVHPTGSGSSLRVSVAPEPKVKAAALAILQALQWHGVAMVEFRIRADGTPVFLEVNGRFWNSLALAIYAGVDFPALLAQMAEKGDAVGPSQYKLGLQCRWMLGDFRHLAEVWLGPPAGYPGRFPGRLNTLFSVLTPVSGMYHDNFTLEDPLPEVGDWLDFAVRQVPRAVKRSKLEAADDPAGSHSRTQSLL